MFYYHDIYIDLTNFITRKHYSETVKWKMNGHQDPKLRADVITFTIKRLKPKSKAQVPINNK